jgi:hypothetical protein
LAAVSDNYSFLASSVAGANGFDGTDDVHALSDLTEYAVLFRLKVRPEWLETLAV